MNGKKKLTTWEASCIITGYGLGAGVLSMPYMAARNGIIVSLGILLAAFVSTYWSLSLALGGILDEMLNLEYRVCWLLATVPSLLLTMIKAAGFLELMRLCGGLIAIIIAFMIVPAYRNAGKEVKGSIMRLGGGTITQILIIGAYLLMAVGSVVSV